MSLTVPSDLLEKAQRGAVGDDEFVDCIRDAMRGAVQRHFGVRLAFQNCCKVGLFRNDAIAECEQFISPRAQLLNQRPELLNC